MNYGYIYKITNNLNNKIYIGKRQSSTFDKNYWGSGTHIKRAINKYGKENFSREILEWCSSKEELNTREKYWIQKLNSQELAIGYNITDGGENSNSVTGRILVHKDDELKYIYPNQIEQFIKLGYELGRSEEQKQKFRGENSGTFGKHLSDSHKEAIGRKFRGKHRSEENCEHVRLSKLGDKNPMYGKVGTEHQNFGKIFVNNGIDTIMIYKHEFEFYKNLGYCKGILRQKIASSISCYCIIDNVKHEFKSINDGCRWWFDNYKPFGEQFNIVTYKRAIRKSINNEPIFFGRGKNKIEVTNIKWYRKDGDNYEVSKDKT